MKKPPLIIVVLPQTAAALRKSVKVWGDTIRGVPTQIVVRLLIRTVYHMSHLNC